MKKISFFILGILLSFQLFSQTTITYSNNAYQVGESFICSDADTTGVQPGEAGEDVNWNFSSISPTTAYQISVIEPAESGDYYEAFPNSNICLHKTDIDGEIYYFYQTFTDSLHYQGHASSFVTGQYLNPEKQFNYPFSYQANFSDSLYAELADHYKWGQSIVTADAYGTITTPAGVFNNVLRIKTEQHTLDTLYFMGSPLIHYEYFITKYQWFSPDFHYPIMTIYWYNELTTGDIGKGVYYLNETPTTITSTENNNFNIYPNPSTGTFTITNYELQIMNIEITDITGKLIYKSELVIPNSQFVINKKGIYFININTENKIYTKKIIIQ